MKKVIMCIMGCLLLCSCSNDKPDSEKFKKEYESYNEKNHYIVEINEENPFVYATVDDINKLAEKKEYFAVYIGNPNDDLSRHLVEITINIADDLNISRVYYLPDDADGVKEYKIKNNIANIPVLIAYADGKIEDSYILNNNTEEGKKLFDDIYNAAIANDVKKLLKKSINPACKDKKSC